MYYHRLYEATIKFENFSSAAISAISAKRNRYQRAKSVMLAEMEAHSTDGFYTNGGTHWVTHAGNGLRSVYIQRVNIHAYDGCRLEAGTERGGLILPASSAWCTCRLHSMPFFCRYRNPRCNICQMCSNVLYEGFSGNFPLRRHLIQVKFAVGCSFRQSCPVIKFKWTM